MTTNIVPLDPITHKDFYLQIDPSYAHVAAQNMAPLLASEFLSASTNFPIVFVKQQKTEQLKAVALFGFTTGENLIFNQGNVFTNYIPVNIRRYPFSAGASNDQESDIILCVDEKSKLLNKSHGVQIFKDDGSLSEATEQISQLITDILAKEEATDNFINFLVENELLQATELSVRLGEDGEHKINGIYKVNEDKLNSLSDDTVLTLYKRKYLPAIYAHLASLSQINRLLKLKANFKTS